MLGVGDRIPAATVFLGPNEPISLLELVEDGPKLFVFYLFDWSATCTNELELLRDVRDELDAAGVQPVGVSRDSPWTHIAWTQVLDLNFGLLSDWNAEAVRGLGIAHRHGFFEDVAERSAFLVDETGLIRGAWSYETSGVPNVDDWLEAARALKAAAPPA